VFAAVQRSGTVRKVVLTSSVAAVTIDCDDWATHTYSPQDWNTKSSLTRNAYALSKTMEEKAAWESIKQMRSGVALVTVCPNMVLGPSLGSAVNLNVSELVVRSLNGRLPILYNWGAGVADVRDVALMHVRAMESSAADGLRFIASHDAVKLDELLREVGGPSGRLGADVPHSWRWWTRRGSRSACRASA
jgi:dihydroflavonol-4-reductase